MKRFANLTLIVVGFLAGMAFLSSCGGSGGDGGSEGDGGTSPIALVSVDPNGVEANIASHAPAISSDGRYVVFYSSATNLVAGDTNNEDDVFVRDMDLGITSRVSVSPAGTEGNNSSGAPAISPDGQHITFGSSATNLVAGDTNGNSDIFVRDMDLGITSRVSVSTAGTEANAYSETPAISADGRYVVFQSYATNLVVGDTNGNSDIFVRDMDLGITSRVSVSTAGTESDKHCYRPTISSDGQYVIFQSVASNLVADDTNGNSDIFVRDMDLGITSRVSVSTAGTEANNSCNYPALSSDGRYVVFQSNATNLVVGDTNNEGDVFVCDMDLGITSRVSVSTVGTEASQESYWPAISSDGRYVVFETFATNLVAGDTNGKADIFVRDMNLGITSRVSVSTAGTQANGYIGDPAISSDGRYVTFESEATNLIDGTTTSGQQIFRAPRQ